MCNCRLGTGKEVTGSDQEQFSLEFTKQSYTLVEFRGKGRVPRTLGWRDVQFSEAEPVLRSSRPVGRNRVIF